MAFFLPLLKKSCIFVCVFCHFSKYHTIYIYKKKNNNNMKKVLTTLALAAIMCGCTHLQNDHVYIITEVQINDSISSLHHQANYEITESELISNYKYLGEDGVCEAWAEKCDSTITIKVLK